MTTGLFIGRFQPFHKGHLSAVKAALQTVDYLYIGIGSTEENYRPANPFTVAERIQLIGAALKEAKIAPETYTIIPVPNINNYALWPAHVELYIPPFEAIFTGSDVVRTLFERMNEQRKNPCRIEPIRKVLDISSTSVRQRMLDNQSWSELVPPAVAGLLKAWKGPKRIRTIQEAEK